MAILQKLETSYLAILRFVVILISGLLLIAALYLSLSALVNMRDGAKPVEITPKVAPDQVVTEITKVQPNPTAKPATQAQQSPVDPNQADYERAASIIVSFVSKYSRGADISKEGAINVVKTHVEAQHTPALVMACASGLPNVLEKVLSDKKVIELVRRPIWSESRDDLPQHDMTVGRSPVWMVDMTLERYFTTFNQQVDQALVGEEIEREKQNTRKQHAMKSLYMAGGAFGVFLLLALLAIIVRVERNLRPLSHLADKAREAK